MQNPSPFCNLLLHLCKHRNYLKNGLYVKRSISTKAILQGNVERSAVFQDQHEDTKVVKVAIIGVPNSGKSTLINQLIGRKVCPVSKKVHTTRKRVCAVTHEGTTQVVFLDTPGLVSACEMERHNLEDSFLKDSERSLIDADVFGVIHDVSNKWTRDRLDPKVLRLLQFYPNKTSFLILNKIDLMKKKRKLLTIAKMLTKDLVSDQSSIQVSTPSLSESSVNKIALEEVGWARFSNVFMISALSNDGVDKIMEYLLQLAQSGKWLFESSDVTDQPSEKLIEQTVKSKLLEFLPEEVPYIISCKIEYFDITPEDVISAVVGLKCTKSTHCKLVIGKGGQMLRTIISESEQDLQTVFSQQVSLKLSVKGPEAVS